MSKTFSLLIISVMLSVFGVQTFTPSSSDAQQPGEIMFILDASSSMLATDGGSITRIDKAKAAMRATIEGLPPETKVGLRVYGSQIPDTNQAEGCRDTKLISAPKANNGPSLLSSLNAVQAKGWTLMGTSLNEVKQDFTGSGPKSVIILSDGIDTCAPPDACEVAKSLQTNGVTIKVNTVGLLVDNKARAQLTCIAKNSGGDYVDVSDIDRLQPALAALAKREVSLFTTQGIPIKGTLRLDQAPLLLPNTNYTDTITVPQELYYSLDALPNQKITITVKVVGRDLGFSQTDYFRIAGFYSQTNKELKATPKSERFGRSDVTTVIYEIDTSKEDSIDKPTTLAFRAGMSRPDTSDTGKDIPLEISFTTEGGDTPEPVNNNLEDSASNDKAGTTNPLIIVLLTLLAVAIVGGVAYILLKLRGRRSRASQNLDGGPQIQDSDQ